MAWSVLPLPFGPLCEPSPIGGLAVPWEGRGGRSPGSHVHSCPCPCSTTCRWAEARNPPTRPGSHRMCVITKRLHNLARAAERGHLFWRHHIWPHLFHLFGPFTTEAWCQNIANNFRCVLLSSVCFNACQEFRDTTFRASGSTLYIRTAAITRFGARKSSAHSKRYFRFCAWSSIDFAPTKPNPFPPLPQRSVAIFPAPRRCTSSTNVSPFQSLS